MTERILCVDDEPKVLDALRRHLHGQFEIATATSGAAALEMLATQRPFAVIVSDMRMPGMDGIQLLAAVRRRAPDTVRIVLTGAADQQTAIAAVNQGHVFRFLTKPCAPDALAQALHAGVAQYRLVTAEKEILEQTLRGSVKVLADVLALTNPTAFGHATRVQRLVSRLCRQMHVDNPWQIELAAMLFQIGCVSVPAETLERAYRGETLAEHEAQMLEAHPALGADLIRNIPRLEEVARIVAYQQKCFDGSGAPHDGVRGTQIPLGARILKVATDCDALVWSGLIGYGALLELRRRTGVYDPDVLGALEALAPEQEPLEICEVSLHELTPRAVLAEDVHTPDGCLLISRGQAITPSVYTLLRNYARRRGLEQQLRVRVFVESQTVPAAAP